MARHTLTQEEVRDVFNYNSETGELSRKSGRCEIGKTLTANGYPRCWVKGRSYLQHVIVWLYHYGYIPENDIDHINRIRTDNRLDNLREVSRTCNCRNSGMKTSNTSGVKGVSKHQNGWRAYINVGYMQKHVGTTKDFDEAVCMRLAAEQCLNWLDCDSYSSALQYVNKWKETH